MNYELLNGGELAFVGDAYMTLQVRDYLVHQGITQLKKLQSMQIHYVSATSQAKVAHAIEKDLNEIETEIYHRGRNFKSHSSAKNANVIDYRYATALEALWGYWYLTGQKERLDEMFQKMLEVLDE